MKKFTEIERNLITVILDGRRNDYKKEHDFEKVFGRNATIDLTEGRTFLLDEALFGVDGPPEIIYDLLYEVECGNVSYDVMIDALEAAVNGDWENVPSVEEAMRRSVIVDKFLDELSRYYNALRMLLEHGCEVEKLKRIDDEIILALGVEKQGEKSLMECLGDNKSCQNTAVRVFESADLSSLFETNFQTLRKLINLLQELDGHLPQSVEFDAFSCESVVSDMAFIVSGADTEWTEFMENVGVSIYDCDAENYIEQLKEMIESL
ncbi:hypothetical protein ACFVIX_02180 [Bacillus subtilis]|uniref:hypothetical protein n=1 Tax=Bacillus subtilis TaxID=1423 RepID=UPI000345B9A7|nr:hypothetical protein [Bacillus subtilis]MEC0319896.1 hypothetical protein [Bacillus subtilis]UWJ00492.1 hypothetical protein N0B18_16860 [Bacillus subtilis]